MGRNSPETAAENRGSRSQEAVKAPAELPMRPSSSFQPFHPYGMAPVAPPTHLPMAPVAPPTHLPTYPLPRTSVAIRTSDVEPGEFRHSLECIRSVYLCMVRALSL